MYVDPYDPENNINYVEENSIIRKQLAAQHAELLRIHQIVCPVVTREIPDGSESVTIEAVKSLAYRVHKTDEEIAELRKRLAAKSPETDIDEATRRA